MNFFIILAYGISLSMDAFAISICKGIALGTVKLKNALKVGAYFGFFQGVMPLIGYLLANNFREYIESYDHWIAFVLLAFIGGKMIWESLHPDEKDDDRSSLSFKNMLIISIATSIDALAVGIAFSCDGMCYKSKGLVLGIFASCALISIITFILSAIGTKLGKLLECKLKNRAEIAGGIVLVILGIKILIEHLTGFSMFGI